LDWSSHLLHFEADGVVGGVHRQSVGCAGLQLHVLMPQLRKRHYDTFEHIQHIQTIRYENKRSGVTQLSVRWPRSPA
jgi:hypothetical protein